VPSSFIQSSWPTDFAFFTDQTQFKFSFVGAVKGGNTMFVGIPKGGIFFIVPKFTPIVGFVAFGSCRKNNGEQRKCTSSEKTKKNKHTQTHRNTNETQKRTGIFQQTGGKIFSGLGGINQALFLFNFGIETNPLFGHSGCPDSNARTRVHSPQGLNFSCCNNVYIK